MSDDYRWYYCFDSDTEEGWRGGCETRDEALEQGLEEATGYAKTITLMRGKLAKLDVEEVILAETVLEGLRNINEELSDADGEVGGLQHASIEQVVELEVELTAMLQAWLTKHGYAYSTCMFAEEHDEETLEVPAMIEPSR